MNSRGATLKRPEPTRVLQILRQIEDLNFGDFLKLSEILDVNPNELHGFIRAGINQEKTDA